MNSTMEARLRRSCSAAVTSAAFTSGGTRTLTTSVLVTGKGTPLCKTLAFCKEYQVWDWMPPGLTYTCLAPGQHAFFGVSEMQQSLEAGYCDERVAALLVKLLFGSRTVVGEDMAS